MESNNHFDAIVLGAGLSLLRKSDLPLSESGFIKIENTCQVLGFKNVFVLEI